MWHLLVRSFKPDDPTNTFPLSGEYRLCVTPDELKFFALGSGTPMVFPNTSIRNASSQDRIFYLEVGRNTPSGAGILTIRCEDKEIAISLNKAVLEALSSTSTAKKHSNLNHAASKRSSSRSQIGSSSTLHSSSYRQRSGSCSKIDKTDHQRHHVSSHQHHHMHGRSSGESRSRTISEGNHDIRKGIRGTMTGMSGSPMSPSPGSYVSSESAGSSNSIDDNDGLHERKHRKCYVHVIIRNQCNNIYQF